MVGSVACNAQFSSLYYMAARVACNAQFSILYGSESGLQCSLLCIIWQREWPVMLIALYCMAARVACNAQSMGLTTNGNKSHCLQTLVRLLLILLTLKSKLSFVKCKLYNILIFFLHFSSYCAYVHLLFCKRILIQHL